MRRAVRRLGALLALTVLVAGVPVALVLLGGSSWPDSLTWSAVPAGLLRPDDGKLLAGPGFQFWIDLSRPLSRGSVRLRSADPMASPAIVFNHLSERQDLLDLVDGVRLARTLVAQAAWDGVRGREITPGAGVESQADLERIVTAVNKLVKAGA